MQLGVAAACAFLKLVTGIGVEMCVAMTGVIAPSGAILRVGGLEAKLAYANSRERYKLVVLPEENLEEARHWVEEHGSSLKLLPVSHMGQVLAHLHLRSVTEGTTETSLPLLCHHTLSTPVIRGCLCLQPLTIFDAACLPCMHRGAVG